MLDSIPVVLKTTVDTQAYTATRDMHKFNKQVVLDSIKQFSDEQNDLFVFLRTAIKEALSHDNKEVMQMQIWGIIMITLKAINAQIEINELE